MSAASAGEARSRPRPIVLVVLDGFGIGHDPAVDAIAQAHMPNWIEFLERWPHCSLEASEEFVGLPEGQMGNSEVGHLNLGTGQPVLQDLPRIDKSISTGSFFTRPVLLELCARAKEADHTLHLISLVGPGGVHANDRHLVAVAELAARQGVKRVRVHGLLDGRDTPPRSAIEFVPDLETRLAAVHPDAKIATIGGRYYAMDRDKRWERTKKGYDAIVHGVADFHAPSAVAAVETGYARGENDEFIVPTVIDGVDHGTIADGDAVLHCNFRADRARQLVPRPRRHRVHRLRPQCGRPGAQGHPLRHDDRVRGRSAGPGRLRPGGGAVAGRGRLARPAGRSSTSPRPRSTPT